MEKLIGKSITISGMVIKIISDNGDRWETRNTTTNETVFFNKSVLDKAIRLGKAEVISPLGDNESVQ